eukprot:451502_1
MYTLGNTTMFKLKVLLPSIFSAFEKYSNIKRVTIKASYKSNGTEKTQKSWVFDQRSSIESLGEGELVLKWNCTTDHLDYQEESLIITSPEIKAAKLKAVNDSLGTNAPTTTTNKPTTTTTTNKPTIGFVQRWPVRSKILRPDTYKPTTTTKKPTTANKATIYNVKTKYLPSPETKVAKLKAVNDSPGTKTPTTT